MVIITCYITVIDTVNGAYNPATASCLGVLEHSSSCCCSNLNAGTLLLCMSVYAVSVDVLTHAVDLHKTASS